MTKPLLLLLLWSSIASAQSTAPNATLAQLKLTRAIDSTLGVVQFRTRTVRLEGSAIGQAYVGLDLARNEWSNGTVDYLVIVTVVDTTSFWPDFGPSLTLVADADTIVLAGPGNVQSRILDFNGGRTPSVPRPLKGIGAQSISPYPISVDLVQRLAAANTVKVQVRALQGPARFQPPLNRRFSKDGFALLRGFLAQCMDEPLTLAADFPYAAYVPAQ